MLDNNISVLIIALFSVHSKGKYILLTLEDMKRYLIFNLFDIIGG
jgi:hypothetical protein